MSTSQTTASAPTLRNVSTKPRTPHKFFVNLPVTDLQRSIIFFESLGFNFNQQFTDAGGTCMLVGEDAYVMLLTRDKFASFTERAVGDPQTTANALFTISVNSREDVDAMVNKAVAAGGKSAMVPQDLGFMYDWSFYDLDGHPWGVFWMDPSAVNG